ncbi:MAG: GIY-YIG nuclease family protein [Melioribacteraceae bacterium]|nr:GIY-YIG nuclease family protein [Melioribacteraceae bacterium]WKZ69621.1 MAG: GIY-YIG nuclease family protein [Melioribacteraceae bacterium]WKZ69632.1 MAG: GIY-YIG nuclease family protein [Melioribacteraceae bacterium]
MRFLSRQKVTSSERQFCVIPNVTKWSEESHLEIIDELIMLKQYYLYIMTNKSRTLYTGVTNDLNRRVYEHKQKLIKGFTSKYNITKLVYYEEYNDINDAIRREKQIKGWSRKKKIELIESINPEWKDLSEEWE